MSRHKILIISTLILLPFSTAQADWGKLLDRVGQSSQKLLNQNETATPSSSQEQVIAGLKEALEIGTRHAVESVGQTGGYLNNPQIKIPLPNSVQQASKLMRQVGLGKLADDFELSINRAAENAAPQAQKIFVDAIKGMSFQDARQILQGEDNAATRYFEDKTSNQLTTLFEPVIERSLNEVGATQHYAQLEQRAKSLPGVGNFLNVDLTDYVTQQALDGLFVMIAAEEKKIRDNPAARTTEILKQVFGTK